MSYCYCKKTPHNNFFIKKKNRVLITSRLCPEKGKDDFFRGSACWEAGKGSFPDQPSKKKRTGPAFSAGEVRVADVLIRTGHPQGAGPLVLAEQCIPTANGAGHVQLHHPLVRCQFVQRTKVTPNPVRTADVLCSVALGYKLELAL